MLLINSLVAFFRNAFARLATNSRIEGAAALALGYGYGIEDDED